MIGVLVDAGPLVAVARINDAWHERCVAALEAIHEPLFTVWPALTEAMHLIESLEAQNIVWQLIEEQQVELLALDRRDVPRMRALMHKYRDLPMDLADAALVRVAERDGFRTVLTTDTVDFGVYRLHGKERFKLLP